LLRWRCRRELAWQFVLTQRRLKIQEKALEVWREMNSELTRFYPIVLEFWKRVLLPSDEVVDLLVVKIGARDVAPPQKDGRIGNVHCLEALKQLMSILITAPLLWQKF
jgi:hypothetical protein